MSARLIRWQSAHLTDLLLIKSVWKIRKNSLKWEVASNWHLTFFGWNSPKKYVFTRIFYKSTEFPTNRKKLDYSPPLILKLKFIAFIIFLQNSNRSNMCAAIAQRRLVTRKFQIEENMRIVALKSTQKMPRRICAARCWKCPARNTCGPPQLILAAMILPLSGLLCLSVWGPLIRRSFFIHWVFNHTITVMQLIQ